MKIGYACLTLGVPKTDMRSCIQKNATADKLMELIAHNLNSLEHMIEYNSVNRIGLLRISSDLIPFGSSPVNQLHWWDLFGDRFQSIGDQLKIGDVRVSMHPGQYTVLNSPDEDVVKRAIADLDYHARVLDALHTGPDSKIVLHIGGVYGNKEKAMLRFAENYKLFNSAIKQRLIIENDDRSYSVSDVLRLGNFLGIPVVYDTLHNRVNPSQPPYFSSDENAEFSTNRLDEDVFWIKEAKKTWGDHDGRQKIHYSQQEFGKRPGTHSSTINTGEFLAFYQAVKDQNIDVMLEVKDKNLSVVKCCNLVDESKKMKALEQEWSRYKYAVLERSPNSYREIRALLKEKEEYPAEAFYQMIDAAMRTEPDAGSVVNAAQHIWGYFKEQASDAEKKRFQKSVEEYGHGKIDRNTIKRQLRFLTEKYQEPYLMNSYYFLFR